MAARPRARSAALLAALVAGATYVAGAAEAGPRDPLYVWTDAEGVTRYSTHLRRIPPLKRIGVRTVERQDAAALELRIAELEGRIAADQALLTGWLGGRGDVDPEALREVSDRLPRLQAELRALRSRRPSPADE